MSLYLDYEICEGCKYARFHTCGRCLGKCDINKLGEVDRCHGNCDYKGESNE